jgi:hypothetical protein
MPFLVLQVLDFTDSLQEGFGASFLVFLTSKLKPLDIFPPPQILVAVPYAMLVEFSIL